MTTRPKKQAWLVIGCFLLLCQVLLSTSKSPQTRAACSHSNRLNCHWNLCGSSGRSFVSPLSAGAASPAPHWSLQRRPPPHAAARWSAPAQHTVAVSDPSALHNSLIRPLGRCNGDLQGHLFFQKVQGRISDKKMSNPRKLTSEGSTNPLKLGHTPPLPSFPP
jgi:hypothetical protein